MKNLRNARGKLVKYILRYLDGTKYHGITYRKGAEARCEIYSLCDVNISGGKSDSTSALVFIRAGRVIFWRSIKVCSTVQSKVEVESISLYHKLCELL